MTGSLSPRKWEGSAVLWNFCDTSVEHLSQSTFVDAALAPWCGEAGEGTRELDVEDLGSVSVPPPGPKRLRTHYSWAGRLPPMVMNTYWHI